MSTREEKKRWDRDPFKVDTFTPHETNTIGFHVKTETQIIFLNESYSDLGAPIRSSRISIWV